MELKVATYVLGPTLGPVRILARTVTQRWHHKLLLGASPVIGRTGQRGLCHPVTELSLATCC